MSGGFIVNDTPTSGGAPTADQVWEGIGDALDADPTRAPELAATLGTAPADTHTFTGASTGWTSTGGNGTATTGSAYGVAFASGTASTVAPTSSHPRHVRALALPRLHGRWAIVARVVSAPDDSSYRLCLSVGKADLSEGVAVVIGRSGGSVTVELGRWSATAPAYATDVAAGGSLPTDATGWIRLSGAGGVAWLEYGTGTTTARPESWTLHGSTPAQPLAFQSLALYLARWAGSNGLSGSFDDVSIEAYP